MVLVKLKKGNKSFVRDILTEMRNPFVQKKKELNIDIMSIYLNLYSYRFVRKRIIKLITRREKTIKNFAKIKYKKDE